MRNLLVYLAVPAVLLALMPSPGAADVQAGEGIYARQCTRCHGPSGTGNEKAIKLLKKDLNLLRPEVASRSDAELLRIISEGRKPMPAFGTKLTAAEREDVLAWVRHLQGRH